MNPLKYLFGLDSYERHRAVSNIIRTMMPRGSTILDIGGENGLTCNSLKRFLCGYKITNMNVRGKCDQLYDGRNIPFPKDSFDVVVSLDSLEHVPAEARQGLVEEFCERAKHLVVCCFPVHSDYCAAADKRAYEKYQKLFPETWHQLSEHIDYGLPRLEEIRTWTAGRNAFIRFGGDVRIWEKQYPQVFWIDRKMGLLRVPVKMAWILLGMLKLKRFNLQTRQNIYTRRCFLAINTADPNAPIEPPSEEWID